MKLKFSRTQISYHKPGAALETQGCHGAGNNISNDEEYKRRSFGKLLGENYWAHFNFEIDRVAEQQNPGNYKLLQCALLSHLKHILLNYKGC